MDTAGAAFYWITMRLNTAAQAAAGLDRWLHERRTALALRTVGIASSAFAATITTILPAAPRRLALCPGACRTRR